MPQEAESQDKGNLVTDVNEDEDIFRSWDDASPASETAPVRPEDDGIFSDWDAPATADDMPPAMGDGLFGAVAAREWVALVAFGSAVLVAMLLLRAAPYGTLQQIFGGNLLGEALLLVGVSALPIGLARRFPRAASWILIGYIVLTIAFLVVDKQLIRTFYSVAIQQNAVAPAALPFFLSEVYFTCTVPLVGLLLSSCRAPRFRRFCAVVGGIGLVLLALAIAFGVVSAFSIMDDFAAHPNESGSYFLGDVALAGFVMWVGCLSLRLALLGPVSRIRGQFS